MVEMIKWFDREFTFDLPLWMYPNVVERLRGAPARAEDIVYQLEEKLSVSRTSLVRGVQRQREWEGG